MASGHQGRRATPREPPPTGPSPEGSGRQERQGRPRGLGRPAPRRSSRRFPGRNADAQPPSRARTLSHTRARGGRRHGVKRGATSGDRGWGRGREEGRGAAWAEVPDRSRLPLSRVAGAPALPDSALRRLWLPSPALPVRPLPSEWWRAGDVVTGPAFQVPVRGTDRSPGPGGARADRQGRRGKRDADAATKGRGGNHK